MKDKINILNEKLPKLIWWRKIELQNNILIKLTQRERIEYLLDENSF
jgi:hypothetical protein